MAFTNTRMAAELRRIADSLEFLAAYVAKKEGIAWRPSRTAKPAKDSEPAILMHTDDAEMLVMQMKEIERFAADGDGNG